MTFPELTVYSRTYDFLNWLLPISNRIPRSQWQVYTRLLLEAAFDLREHVKVANRRLGKDRLICLEAADISLGRLRLYLRLAINKGWLNLEQYLQVADMMAEINRQLIAWKNVTHA